MRDLLQLGLVVACGLMVVAAAVLIGHDTTMLVSPPEAVAETFVRNLLASRYDIAMQEVDDRSPVSLATVSDTAEALKRACGNAEPNAADGDRATIAGDEAEAVVAVRSRSRTIRWVLELRRVEVGVWRVTGWQEWSGG